MRQTSNYYYYGARYYDPRLSIFLSVDPLVEETMTPYQYCNNNPVNLVDPTEMVAESADKGDDIFIYYKDNKGRDRRFRFNGLNTNEAPKNHFVQDFLTAYKYNISNGGGDNMKYAAFDRGHPYLVVEQDVSISSSAELWRSQELIRWSPTQGLKLESGDILSPATVAEHEFDHAVFSITNSKEKFYNSRLKEENRVLMGSETKTAKANGEISINQKYTRTDYYSNKDYTVPVYGPTSTKINKLYNSPFSKSGTSGYEKSLYPNFIQTQ